MKKLALLGIGAAAITGVFVATHQSHAADHLDSPTAMANPMADIGDVYAWMDSTSGKVNLAMTVSPKDDGTHSFDNSIQYAWHITNHPGQPAFAAFGKAGATTNVICTFTENTSIQCWVVSGTTVLDYVTGDPSEDGISSADGKLTVFAGRRSDPFFFNLGGFKSAVAEVEEAGSNISLDAAGCPQLDAITAGGLRTLLASPPTTAISPCAALQIDCFQTFDVMALVVQVDPGIVGVDASNILLSVWGSTHATVL